MVDEIDAGRQVQLRILSLVDNFVSTNMYYFAKVEESCEIIIFDIIKVFF